MPHNVEIKARVADRAALEARVRALADRGPEDLAQEDTFFACPRGRLKLRALAPDHGELIAYERPDAAGPKVSSYAIARTSSPGVLRDVLTRALGASGRVRKRRRLYHLGRTRIHLDSVEELGEFLELEVVLGEGEDLAAGQTVADALLRDLGVAREDLVAGAYVDLLRDAPRR